MKIASFPGIVAAAIALVAGLFLLPPAAISQEKTDPFYTGAPFSLTYLLESVGTIPDRRLTIAISHRGVDFRATPADIEQLKKAGAGPDLIKMIAASAPAAPPPVTPPPPPPPPPPVAGLLTLKCAPVECDITVNGKAHGSTSGGALELRGLSPGEAQVEFKKDGFETQQATVMLRAGMPARHNVTLKPTAETEALVAKQLLARMVAKLGGAPALADASTIAVSGNASLWQSGGQRTEWQVTARLRLPSMAMIEISGAGLKWWTSLSSSDSKADGTKQMKGGPVAVEMEKLVRMYRDYQPSVLVQRLEKMNLSTTEIAPDASGQSHFQATGNDETLKITLNADAVPVRAVYESASGLGSGLEILYGDYITVEKIYYPKAFTIKFADQAQHGFELHLQDVKFPAKLTDKDFHR